MIDQQTTQIKSLSGKKCTQLGHQNENLTFINIDLKCQKDQLFLCNDCVLENDFEGKTLLKIKDIEQLPFFKVKNWPCFLSKTEQQQCKEIFLISEQDYKNQQANLLENYFEKLEKQIVQKIRDISKSMANKIRFSQQSRQREALKQKIERIFSTNSFQKLFETYVQYPQQKQNELDNVNLKVKLIMQQIQENMEAENIKEQLKKLQSLPETQKLINHIEQFDIFQYIEKFQTYTENSLDQYGLNACLPFQKSVWNSPSYNDVYFEQTDQVRKNSFQQFKQEEISNKQQKQQIIRLLSETKKSKLIFSQSFGREDKMLLRFKFHFNKDILQQFSNETNFIRMGVAYNENYIKDFTENKNSYQFNLLEQTSNLSGFLYQTKLNFRNLIEDENDSYSKCLVILIQICIEENEFVIFDQQKHAIVKCQQTFDNGGKEWRFCIQFGSEHRSLIEFY